MIKTTRRKNTITKLSLKNRGITDTKKKKVYFTADMIDPETKKWLQSSGVLVDEYVKIQNMHLNKKKV